MGGAPDSLRWRAPPGSGENWAHLVAVHPLPRGDMPVMTQVGIVCAYAYLLAGSAAAEFFHSGSPANIAASTDCAIRELAWEYGKKLRPDRGDFSTLFDALQLGACNISSPTSRELDEWRPLDEPLEDHLVLLVASDTEQQGPAGHFQTLEDAVAASRQLRKIKGEPITIALRAGTHYFARTLQAPRSWC